MTGDQDWKADDHTGLVAAGLASSVIPLVLVDNHGTVVEVSEGAAFLLGCAREAILGAPLERWMVPPGFLKDCQAGIACRAGALKHAELRRPDGEVVPVEVMCSSFQPYDADGPGHCLLYLTDTSMRTREDEIRAMRMAKLSLFNQVSDALYGADLTLDQILQAVLICITAGEGLRFNRAFLLLVDEEGRNLQGEMAIGPSDPGEAARIWENLADQPGDLYSMMTSYDSSLKQTDVAVNEIVRQMVFPLEETDHLLVRVMNDHHVVRVTRDMVIPGVESIRTWLKTREFAVAPLTTRRGPVGVILADNAISGNEIGSLDLEFLQLFANQSAGAIENSRLYHELERRLVDLRKAHQKQKEDQQTLMRMERLSVMGETSAIVAHELRNPLVAIGGFARTLTRALDDGDPNRKFAEIISEEVARMEVIIHDLLDFIRPKKVMRKRTVLNDLVARTTERYRQQMEDKEIGLSLDLRADGVEVACHPGEIQQVIQNYLVNAIQVLATGGTICVKTRVLEGGVEVEVVDDGPGVPPGVTDKLFTPFYSTKPTGSGLGLTICAQIIKAHGGVTGVRNGDENGAVFSFILPLPK